MSKTRIQLIGSFLAPLEMELSQLDIRVESHIQACNPLAMQGTVDIDYIKKADEKNTPVHSVLNIRKNLSQMLSRQSENFCSNYNTQPLGREVRYNNTSEYLVFMNSSSELPLYEYNGCMVYTASDDVFNSVKKSGFVKRDFPYSGSFNWKYYYDKFINAVLDEYDGRHIILIKTNSAQWFEDGREIKCFSKRSSLYRNMINEMDEYFIERTQCRVIKDHFNHIPPRFIQNYFPFIQMSGNTYKELAREIKSVILFNDNIEYIPSLPKYVTDFSRFFFRKLSSDIAEKNADIISEISEKRLTLKDIKSANAKDGSLFLADIIKLERFLDPENEYTISDYIIESGDSNRQTEGNNILSLAELYTKYFKLDINDIIAVYILSEQYSDKSVFRGIVNNILCNSDCTPVYASKVFKKRNIDFLKEYPYISEKDFAYSNGDVYIRLENNCWLVLNPDSDMPIRKFDFIVPEKFDFEKVISDGYVCTIENADALTYSYDYYIEKARSGDGAKPTYLSFESGEEFEKSLNYIDYVSLLENEDFVFKIDERYAETPERYLPVVDLTEMLNPNLVTVKIEAGLGDQLGYYIFGQILKSFYHKEVIYDDLFYLFANCFNGFELPKFAVDPLNLLSRKLSARLRQRDIFNRMYKKISPNYVYLSNVQNRLSLAGGALSVLFGNCSSLKQFIALEVGYKYYNAIIHCEDLKKEFNYDIHDYICFPPLNGKEQNEIAQKMLNSDSVAIHVRRGDYVTYFEKIGQPQLDNGFYPEAIQKIMQMDQYTNKKFFVFSDDLIWCKLHRKELGLNNIEDCEVVFVDTNKGAASYQDMQMMALAKILICAQSGFARFAAHYNDNLEILICHSVEFQSLYETYIRKNKYDIGNIAHTRKATFTQRNNLAPRV